ncbi:MAG: hypothetical protein EOO07_30020 [Chitinophagaceae bacterium]|nr:MAG: hypothetical protein EOO07_30020 [Chitinophagaceae bacterium]
MIFNINPKAQINALEIGDKKIPVIFIDSFLDAPDDLIKLATDSSASFEKKTDTFYPGVRAQLPSEYVKTAVASVLNLIRQTYGVPDNLTPCIAPSHFSLVTLSSEELKPVQKIPHIDSARIYDFAVLLYLNPGSFGGTSFYRHKTTGFDLISEAEASQYWESVKAVVDNYANVNRSYIREDTNDFEKIGGITYLPNRLVIYPGALLHSPDISSNDINNDPKTGRLTANIIISFLPANGV